MADICKVFVGASIGPTAKIYRFDGFSNTVVDSFALGYVYGLSADVHDGDLYVSHTWAAQEVWKYDGFSNTVDGSFSIPHNGTGMTIMGGNLYTVSYGTNKLYKHNGISGTVTDSFTVPYPGSGGPTSLTNDGTNLMNGYYASGGQYTKYSGDSSTVLASFNPTGKPPGTSYPWGIAWDPDNSNLVVDWHQGGVEHSGFSNTKTGNVVNTWVATLNADSQADIFFYVEQIDKATITLQYETATSGIFADVTSALGNIGADVVIDGSKAAYWDNPSQDRSEIDVASTRMRIQAVLDPGNTGSYTAVSVSAQQLSTADGTGDVGDVKVTYEVT